MQRVYQEHQSLCRRRTTRWQPIDESPAQSSTREEIPSSPSQVGGDLVLEMPMNEQIEVPPIEPQERPRTQVEQGPRQITASRDGQDAGWITPQEEPTWIDRANSTRFLRCRAKKNTSGRVMMFLNRAIHNDQGQYKELSMHMNFEHDMHTFLDGFHRGSKLCTLEVQEELVYKLDCISEMIKTDMVDMGHRFSHVNTGSRRRRAEDTTDGPPRQRMRL